MAQLGQDGTQDDMVSPEEKFPVIRGGKDLFEQILLEEIPILECRRELLANSVRTDMPEQDLHDEPQG